MAISEDKIKGMKHFANKLWNIARFVMTNVEQSDWTWEEKTEADKIILQKLNEVIASVTKHLENYQLHEAAQGIYHFTWHELADIYIESSREQLQNPELADNTKKILLHNLVMVVKLLHPFMPFITEYIWDLLGERGLRKTHDPLLISKWPKTEK
jgi:valyl-tRNA synthetase